MKLLLICAILHIGILVSHPVQDKINSEEHEYTCNYLKHHLEFLEDATKVCKKDFKSIQGGVKKYCETSGEEVIKSCATDKHCLTEFMKHVETSETLGQCSCIGLTKAVARLSDFAKHLCDDNGERDEKFFLTKWSDKLAYIKDLLGSQCISTPAKYVEHLDLLLTSPSTTEVGTICKGVRLGTTIQTLDPGTKNPITLSPYGDFWAWGSGPDVAATWLPWAKNANGDKLKFTTDALHHVGFSDIPTNQRIVMVVFDMKNNDQVWLKSGGVISFQPRWKTLFSYVGGKFKVCDNPKPPFVTGPGDCVVRTVTISKPAQDIIINTPWSTAWRTITGCPSEDDSGSTYDSCMTACKHAASAVQYCQYVNIMGKMYDGKIKCVDDYEAKKPAGLTTSQEALWARVWFEKCWGCNPWFTGVGRGYDPSAGVLTGTEWIVRGDVANSRLGPAASTEIYP